ncbi:MAG: hypothetical protein JSW54_11385, partial [Fidelibacterota bacterium]
DGYYRLGNLAPGTYDLVAHHIGFELEVREILITGNDTLRYDFKLRPKVIQGDEVIVLAPQPKGLLWSLHLARFQDEFIGETEYSRECKILNPEVLNFQIDPDTKEFIASSDQVLEIENQALGYMIHVIIQEYRSQLPSSSVGFHLRYTILPRFEVLEPGNRQTMEKWERNRLLCYVGSLRHFLATLAGNGDSSNSFRIYSGGPVALKLGVGEILSTDELQVTLDDETLFIRWESDNWMRVVYGVDQRDQRNSSIIRLPEGYTLFDRFGNCMFKYSIEMQGYWALKRMADALPFDYRPNL